MKSDYQVDKEDIFNALLKYIKTWKEIRSIVLGVY
jgi:hypothetical protein